MIIEIDVAEKRATARGEPTIVCGNGGYQIHFTFDDEWAAENRKTARFVYTAEDKTDHIDVDFDGTDVNVPILYNIDEVLVGVYVGDRLTTTPAHIPCERSIRCHAAT